MTTDKGVWGLQQVRDKQLQSLWNYSAFGDAGTLWSMGYNNGGDLGQNNRTKYSSPTQIPGSWKGIGGVKSDGTLWSWGYNGVGALGLNDTIHRSSPTQVGSDTTWAEVYGLINNQNTEKEAYGIKTDGTLWAWGFNAWGQLGLNDAGSPGNQSANSRSSPVQVGSDTTWPTTGYNKFGWSSSYIGGAAIKTDGTLWVWGRKDYGILAQNNQIYYSSPVQIPGTTWKSLSRGLSGFNATKTDGTLWVWGRNADGELGLNSRIYYSSPVQVGSDTTWDMAGGGNSTACVTKTDGTMWAWGINTQNQLGQGDGTGNPIIPTPTKISSPVQIGTATDWSRPVQLGQNAMGAIKTDNTLWVWGEGAGGILGQNSLADRAEPTQIPGAGVNIRGSESVTHIMKEA